jgi:hypothetical protein
MARHEIDGTEHSLGTNWPGGHYLTANVPFFANALTLFAGRRAYARLDKDQRAALRKAAEQTVARAVAHPPPEGALVRRYCDGGRVVAARRDDLVALARAARPVYAGLDREPQTKALIAAIRELKAKTAVPPMAAAPRCAPEASTTHGPEVPVSTLNGTYRQRLTKAGAVAAGLPDDPDIGHVNQITLRDGKWIRGPAGAAGRSGAGGTYEIRGDRIIFDWPAQRTGSRSPSSAAPAAISTSSPSCRWIAATASTGPAGSGGASAHRWATSLDAKLSARDRRTAARRAHACRLPAGCRHAASRRAPRAGRPARAGPCRLRLVPLFQGGAACNRSHGNRDASGVASGLCARERRARLAAGTVAR